MKLLKANKLKLFIADDDYYMQNLLIEFLVDTYDIYIFNNGIEVVNYMHSGEIPDILVTDLNMPDLNGLELIKQLKSSDFFSVVPIIVLSGDDSSEMRIKCLDEGADDYLVKPFSPLELEARLRVILRRVEKKIIQVSEITQLVR